VERECAHHRPREHGRDEVQRVGAEVGWQWNGLAASFSVFKAAKRPSLSPMQGNTPWRQRHRRRKSFLR
jgi:hypothetical protein